MRKRERHSQVTSHLVFDVMTFVDPEYRICTSEIERDKQLGMPS